MHFEDFIEQLAQQIKERRKILGVTQQELADISGVGLRTLKKIETLKANPTLEIVLDLLDALGMQITLETKKITPTITPTITQNAKGSSTL